MSDPKPFDKQSYRIGPGGVDKHTGCLIIVMKPGVWFVAIVVLGIVVTWGYWFFR